MKNTEKAIFAEVKVLADLEDVWDAWTTEKGIKTFLAPACKVDLLPDDQKETTLSKIKNFLGIFQVFPG